MMGWVDGTVSRVPAIYVQGPESNLQQQPTYTHTKEA